MKSSIINLIAYEDHSVNRIVSPGSLPVGLSVYDNSIMVVPSKVNGRAQTGDILKSMNERRIIIKLGNARSTKYAIKL